MAEPALTRRSLLGATAGAALASALNPAGALAALTASSEPVIREQRVGKLPAGITSIDLEASADMVAVAWLGDPAGPQLRAPAPAGGFSRWVAADSCCGAGHAHSLERSVGDPLWTGPIRSIQLRSGQPLEGVRLYLLDSGASAISPARALFGAAAGASSLPLAQPQLAAGPGQPPIIARRAWAGTDSPPSVAPEYGDVRMAFVHHTDNPNGYGMAEVPAMIKAIYGFHRFVNGWDDIGYNFVIDLFGRIFEARAGGIDEPVVGAQAGGYNAESSGIAVLGTFNSEGPGARALQALERLLAWKLALHGVTAQGGVTVRVNPAGAIYSRFPAGAHVRLPHIAGHRDGDTTDCPGNVLYGELAAVRARAARLQGPVGAATIGFERLPAAAAPEAAGPGTAPEPGTAAEGKGTTAAQPIVISGRLETIGSGPLAGAAVTLQERIVTKKGQVVHERPLAQATTAADGIWSLSGELRHARGGTWLRAFFPGARGAQSQPVAVSAPLHLPGVFRPAPAGTGSTPPAGGESAPTGAGSTVPVAPEGGTSGGAAPAA